MGITPHEGNLCSQFAEKMLSIKINSRCNRSCSFCVDRDGRNHTRIVIDDVADRAVALEEYKTVIITGGEPFLDFKDVISLLEKIRPFKKRIVLNTNGTLLSLRKTRELNGLIDELQVSVHHFDELVNSEVFSGDMVGFESMRDALTNRDFELSINSCFHNLYIPSERPIAVGRMISLCNYFNAERLRLTELKKVGNGIFVPAGDFFESGHSAIGFNSNELITKGCTFHYTEKGVKVSVKRLCEYAKGKNAVAFSCCFVDVDGQKKIDIETHDTFRVIYGDGVVTNDWVYNK